MVGTSIAGLAEATPSTRDRYVDFLRAFSILVVVIGHYFIAVAFHQGGRVYVENAVGRTSLLWLLTWALQVMPLFFFVGGFSNLVSWKGGYAGFLRGRLRRLLTPFSVFAAVWLVIEVALHLFDVGAGGGIFRLSRLPFGPLWFLGVYLAVVAVAPLMIRLHRLAPLLSVVTLFNLILVVDTLRFAMHMRNVGWLNLAFVWLFAHQLGFFYGDGHFDRWHASNFVALSSVGLTGMALLTNIGVYPRSMVGVDHEAISNMSPPTACIAFLTLWLVGLAMLLRPRLTRWLQGRRAWSLVIGANAVIMTTFLWHLSALLVTILVLERLGLPPQPDTNAVWWLTRPLWIAIPLGLTGGLVAVFSRFERPR
jgi:fucose 4-O-acetylase-like acetyltransferase